MATGSTGTTALTLSGTSADSQALPVAAVGWATAAELFAWAGFSPEFERAAATALGVTNDRHDRVP